MVLEYNKNGEKVIDELTYNTNQFSYVWILIIIQEMWNSEFMVLFYVITNKNL